jgi:hypothetical protein
LSERAYPNVDWPDHVWNPLNQPDQHKYDPDRQLRALDPEQATQGDPDTLLRCLGDGFTAESVIYFNNGPENTSFTSEREVTTVVKTSGTEFEINPGNYPVKVVTGIDWTSDELEFVINAAPEEPPIP